VGMNRVALRRRFTRANTTFVIVQNALTSPQ